MRSGPAVRSSFAALLLVFALAACGADATNPSASATATGGGGFPVTIQHKYGSTTVKAEPQRIVTVGLTDQDAVLALGKVPVGTTEWLGGYPGAIGPWAKDRLGPAAVPTVLTDTGGGPQIEKIAALRPDLILAVYSGLTKEHYETLSKIAPVVAQPGKYADYGVPWDEQTTTIGAALGRPAEAKQLVETVQAKIAAAAKANPAFAGASGLVATPYEGIFVYGSQDLRSRVLTGLGFKVPAELDKVVGEQFGANLSKERTDLLDQDVIVWIVADPAADQAKLHGDQLYGALDVVRQGREIYIGESSDYGHATSFVSALSLPYLVERLVPQLAAAVDGNTATTVPAG